MDSNIIINLIKKFCKDASGDEHIWNGNKSTYHWNLGKTTSDGVVNGVVRKLAGISNTGEKIWVVAGSVKILPNGTVARFTGLNKKFVTKIINDYSERVVRDSALEEENVIV
jgi:hypothetical protein